MSILADTSVLLAIGDRSDRSHRGVLDCVARTPETLVVPVTVLPEADYLITQRVGPATALAMLGSVAAGELQLEQLTLPDLQRSIELLRQYADSNIGFVDASIVAIAERLKITRVLTLDHRRFRMIRPKHCPSFELLP
jgi:predicted nucleic acid-binding protein